jgi:hypothetical protein
VNKIVELSSDLQVATNSNPKTESRLKELEANLSNCLEKLSIYKKEKTMIRKELKANLCTLEEASKKIIDDGK